MNISGSSIVAHYAGNAALGVDSQAARQARDKNPAAHPLKEVKPTRPSEPILEGELVNERLSDKSFNDSITGEEFFARQQSSHGTVTERYANQAIAEYKDNAQLDGIADAKPLRHLDLFV